MKRFEPDAAALYPADVLGRARRAAGGAARSGIDPLVPLRSTRRRCRKPEGFSITLSPFRRPTIETMPVDAKAGCLYPNNARALLEAKCARLRQLPDVRHARAMSPSSPTPTCSWPRMASSTRRRRTAHSSTASRASASSSCCATPASTVVERHVALSRLRNRRRDILHRQLLEGHAGHPHRRAFAAAGPVLSQGARALLGVRA